MTRTNQAGEPIKERRLFQTYENGGNYTDYHRNVAIALILEHLGLMMFETNATKHGNTEMRLEKDE